MEVLASVITQEKTNRRHKDGKERTKTFYLQMAGLCAQKSQKNIQLELINELVKVTGY